MFMVFAAPVYDKRIKCLVRDVSLSILNIYNRSTPSCKSRGPSLVDYMIIQWRYKNFVTSANYISSIAPAKDTKFL